MTVLEVGVPMQDAPSRPGSPTPTLERLLSLGDRVQALTRNIGRAFVEGDTELAASLLAADGEHERIDSALDGAWSDILRGQTQRSAGDLPAGVGLVASLQNITDLAAKIGVQVIRLSDEGPKQDQPAIRKLAQMVPELLRDALGALRQNDRSTADRVLARGLAVDACFAQTYLELLSAVGVGGEHMETAQRLHAVTAALERIGDGASDIANGVRKPVTAHA